MINYKGSNFFFALLALVILMTIISPFSINNHVDAKSDQGDESSSSKGDNGKGHDKGDDVGSDGDYDGGSDGDDYVGSDGDDDG